nr:MAG TPA: PROTEIN (ALPHA-2U-GLOBULIN)-GLOBULIN, LIPID BINDING PROTEIN.5A [Caudoviricetes sp.]
MCSVCRLTLWLLLFALCLCLYCTLCERVMQ